MIEKAVKNDPESRWWNKGYRVDVVKGLWEYVNGIWAGDVDLADGKVAAFFEKYNERKKWEDGLGLNERSSLLVLTEDLTTLDSYLKVDLEFVHHGEYILYDSYD